MTIQRRTVMSKLKIKVTIEEKVSFGVVVEINYDFINDKYNPVLQIPFYNLGKMWVHTIIIHLLRGQKAVAFITKTIFHHRIIDS